MAMSFAECVNICLLSYTYVRVSDRRHVVVKWLINARTTYYLTIDHVVPSPSLHDYATVLQVTTDLPSFVPGVHTIGDELSNVNSTFPFFPPVNWTLALAFAAFSPIPTPMVMLSGLIVKPLPRPKSLEPA